MHSWNLTKNDPLNLVIAADARLSSTNYVDDQIWELTLEGGEPPALALHTTYGLRANSIRLFPRFSDGSKTVTDPQSFHKSPIIKKIFPNYLRVEVSPFPGVDVVLEYLVPNSQGCCGRILFYNSTEQVKTLGIEWSGILTPRNGKRLSHQEIDGVITLSGYTENIHPVIYLTKGARAGQGPYPSLINLFNLSPGDHLLVMWAHAALSKPEESFQLCRSLTTIKWEAEIARVEINNSRKLDIRTDDENWDSVVMLSQNLAYNLIQSPTKFLPNPSFVLSRLPDQGYSALGDGSDYQFLWNGQTALDTLYLSGFLLPADYQVVEDVFKNFLHIQDSNGFIDWKPGLAGQRAYILTTPVLINLAYRIYEIKQDKSFLDQTFGCLWDYYNYWLQKSRDVDNDGIPEWDHILQTAVDDHPKYNPWSPVSDGIDIRTVETPGLLSLIYKEGQILAEIASILGKDKESSYLLEITQKFKKQIGKFYIPEKKRYLDRDRDTHLSATGSQIFSNTGNGVFILKKKIKPRARLIISLIHEGNSLSQPQITIYGKDRTRKNTTLKLAPQNFKRFLERYTHSTDEIFTFIEKISIQGIDPADNLSMYTADFNFIDVTQYLPLWAGIPDQATADEMITACLHNSGSLLAEYGIKTFDPGGAGTVENAVIHPIWITFFLEGLLNYGYRLEAADLMTRYIQIIIRQVRSEKKFRHHYNAITGLGLGEKNHLHGIIPIDCFLRILGIKFLGGFQIRIEGFNPFPWTVKVNYQGTSVTKQAQLTTVVFPDGQTIQINEPDPRIINWEHDSRVENLYPGAILDDS